MITLITILPLVGSFLFININAEAPFNSDKSSFSSINIQQKNNSIIKQIGLSTSLIVLFLTIYILSKSSLILPNFSNELENFSNLVNIYPNIENSIQFGTLNSSSINELENIDSISLYYILLTAFITPICLLSNWRDITIKIKYFVFSFLLLETLQISFFLVTDLLLFYIYFESVLIPLFMVVGIFGSGSNKIRSAFLLFLYTLAGSLPMLIAILFIFYNLGSVDFEFISMYTLSYEVQMLFGFCFLLAFAVKSPIYPFHLWLFRAHSESSTAGSVLLAAIILKFATFGFLKVLLPLFPDFVYNNLYLIQTLAVITLIYSSLVTIRQTDIKAIVAYSSVAHMAVCILGLFSNSVIGIEGAILLSLAHGLVSPALFILVGGVLYNRYHTRIINYYRGVTIKMPLFSLIFFLFIIFNASAPLSLNFVGEFLSLAGLFQSFPVIGALGATGIVFSAIYSIFLFNRICFLGFSPYLKQEIIPANKNLALGDLTRLEFYLLFPLLLVTVLFGIFPNIILDSLHYDVSGLIYNVNSPNLPFNNYFIPVTE